MRWRRRGRDLVRPSDDAGHRAHPHQHFEVVQRVLGLRIRRREGELRLAIVHVRNAGVSRRRHVAPVLFQPGDEFGIRQRSQIFFGQHNQHRRRAVTRVVPGIVDVEEPPSILRNEIVEGQCDRHVGHVETEPRNDRLVLGSHIAAGDDALDEQRFDCRLHQRSLLRRVAFYRPVLRRATAVFRGNREQRPIGQRDDLRPTRIRVVVAVLAVGIRDRQGPHLFVAEPSEQIGGHRLQRLGRSLSRQSIAGKHIAHGRGARIARHQRPRLEAAEIIENRSEVRPWGRDLK